MRASFITNAAASQSFPANLHVQTKIIICFFCSLSAILLSGITPMVILVLASVVYALCTGKIKGILIAYAGMTFMLATSVLFVYIATLFFPEFADIDPKRIILPFLRMILMTNAVLVLALTSRIQLVLSSLKSLRLPGFIYIPASVMIRFVPTFINDLGQIRQTLKIRGYQIGPLTFFLHPIATSRLLIAPLVFRALRSADNLAVAAELKGINAKNKITLWEQEPMRKRDYFTLIVFFGLLVLVYWLQARQGFNLAGH